jgi:hypothetical protein
MSMRLPQLNFSLLEPKFANNLSARFRYAGCAISDRQSTRADDAAGEVKCGIPRMIYVHPKYWF